MKEVMEKKDKKEPKNLIKRWFEELWRHRIYILIALIFVVVQVTVNSLVGSYVTYSIVAAQVPDLILDNFGPYDWSFSFIYVSLFLVHTLFLYPLFFDIPKLHKFMIQLSLIVVIRDFFLIFTHLQTPLDAIPVKFPSIYNIFVYTNDSFFSGHAAFPFLGFLVFNDSKIKWLFLVGSIYMGITTLATHRHYSIDVFAAFFITYGSYKIGEKLLRLVEGFVEKRN